jgi:pyruvate,water dikinase
MTLLALANNWQLSPADDIFWIPLSDVRDAAHRGTSLDPVATKRRAAAARVVVARQRRWRMPLEFADGAPLANRTSGSFDAVTRQWFRGIGTGARVEGVAVRIGEAHQGTPPIEGAIAVVAAVTPAMTFLLQGASAIVAEYGGLLDHGAAIARELGIPCGVDCRGVLAGIADGEPLMVDGAQGLVIKRPSVLSEK